MSAREEGSERVKDSDKRGECRVGKWELAGGGNGIPSLVLLLSN